MSRRRSSHGLNACVESSTNTATTTVRQFLPWSRVITTRQRLVCSRNLHFGFCVWNYHSFLCHFLLQQGTAREMFLANQTDNGKVVEWRESGEAKIESVIKLDWTSSVCFILAEPTLTTPKFAFLIIFPLLIIVGYWNSHVTNKK